MSRASATKKPKSIYDTLRSHDVSQFAGETERSVQAALGTLSVTGEIKKTLAQLRAPLRVRVEEMFPIANFARQLRGLTAAIDMTKTLGVAGVASTGIASHVKAIEEASAFKASALVEMTQAREAEQLVSDGVFSAATQEAARLISEGAFSTVAQEAAHLGRSSIVEAAEGQAVRALAETRIRPLAWRSPLAENFAFQRAPTQLTDGFLAKSSLTTLDGLGSLTAVANFGAASLATKHLTKAFEASRRWAATIDAFEKCWAQTALWFMLSSLSIGHIHYMATMEPAEVEHDLLRALEVIITDGEYAQSLSSALDTAPYLSAVQRDHLQHGLEHAQHGEFERAIPPLMYGMEGALWSTARALAVIDERRRLINRPRRPRARSIEPVIRELPTGEGFSTFVIHRVFGGSGNIVRHGELSADGHHRALFLVVAVAGWLDAVLDVPAHEVLGHVLNEQLSADWRANH
jgi:hypothetical protein